MATATTVPVQEYLNHVDYEPDAEYVDGEIEERPMGQYDHSTWQQRIERWFLDHGREWDIRVRCELRVQVSATRYRVPDVVVFERSRAIEQILTHPPVAVFEVLSPEDRIERMLRKLRDYAAMGIQEIFVIDPEADEVFRFQEGGLRLCEPTYRSAAGSAFIDWNAVRQLED